MSFIFSFIQNTLYLLVNLDLLFVHFLLSCVLNFESNNLNQLIFHRFYFSLSLVLVGLRHLPLLFLLYFILHTSASDSHSQNLLQIVFICLALTCVSAVPTTSLPNTQEQEKKQENTVKVIEEPKTETQPTQIDERQGQAPAQTADAVTSAAQADDLAVPVPPPVVAQEKVDPVANGGDLETANTFWGGYYGGGFGDYYRRPYNGWRRGYGGYGGYNHNNIYSYPTYLMRL